MAGIREISRAIISRKEEGEKHEAERGRECFQLLVEGVGLQAGMVILTSHGPTYLLWLCLLVHWLWLYLLWLYLLVH